MKIRTRQTKLRNGLRVVAVETPHLSSSYVGLLVNVGSRHEAPHDNGLSHFVEHMVFRGTKSFADVQQINVAAESIGGALDAATYRDHTLYGTTSHPSKLDDAIALIGEIATSPRFRFIETERSIIKQEMAESFGARGQMVDIDTLSHTAVYGKHGLGQSIEGTPRLLDRFTSRDLRRQHRQFYCAKNSVLVIAGAVELKRQKKALEKAFASMPTGVRAETEAPKPRPSTSAFHWVDDPGAQVDLRVSFPGISARDKDQAALSALSRVLGEGLSSRLQAELVDKRGLAYSLSAGPEVFVDAGSFDFDFMVSPEKAEETLEAVLDFARDTVRRPPTKAELHDAKERSRIARDFMRDAPADLGLWIGRGLLFQIEHDPERAAKEFYAVTKEDCARVAKRVFDQSPPVVCGVGDVSARLKKALKRLAYRGGTIR